MGIKVEKAEDLDPAMEEAFGEKLKDKLVFLDVWVDPSEHVYPMTIKGGSLKDMFINKSEKYS